jgi:hypothetical protein
MFVSKFLLNRQKIFNSWEIHRVLESHFPGVEMIAGQDYLYRLEWYKIGISVPVLVYSKQRPEMRVCKEFQLFECEECPSLLPADMTECEFSIFLVPDFATDFCPEHDFEKILAWFKEKLEGSAEIMTSESGPNNCIYYDLQDKSYSQQTINLKGTLQIKNRKKLEKLLHTAIGLKPELGCGLLLLKG